ncbi:MAG: hypothetical protein LUG18_09755 [Candidatus Azobacteroides sp.]|nr:hypothetical protein [Candidatus Azobacteroides sp.]
MKTISKVSYLTKRFFLFLLLLIAFSSCKDDMTLEEMKDNIRKNQNDWMKDNLRGKVKKMTAYSYCDSEWVNNAIKEGKICEKRIKEYTNNGFLNTFTTYYYRNDELSIEYKLEVSARDKNNRVCEQIQTSIYYGDDTQTNQSKEVTTYDDDNKTAIRINYYMNNNGEYIELYQTVYKLDEYGRIDGYNFELNVRNVATVDEKEIQMKSIREYDQQGNPVLDCYHYRGFDGKLMVSDHTKWLYEYY